ncbi:MAG: methyltransferase domain-containing protein [Myxococcota bacterium]
MGLTFDDGAARGVEAIYRTPDVAAQRSQTLVALGLAPGERVLDIGVGPGFLADDMARIVGADGHVAGIDTSEPMLAMARARCGEGVDLRTADATALPFDAGAFDAVVSTQVLEYVPDLDGALAEIARVLRVGGRAVILDTDWDTAVWQTEDRARMRRVLDAWEAHLHDPCLPRTLGPRLDAAGLTVQRRDVIPLLNPHLHPNCYSHGILVAIQAFVAGREEVGPEEAAAWGDELRALAAAGRYFFSINRYLFAATKR